jgi:hypothetical protein
MNPQRPNLFEFATSELSQDAVLCWCIAWADSKYAATDPALHALARDLITSMFREANAKAPEGDYTVVIKPQLEHVDIVAEIGADHLLVIEDKVHSSEHSNQLKVYAKALAKLYPNRSRAFIFLKTGDQSSYSSVETDGWTTFRRMKLLEVLRRGSDCTNAIYRDFLASLEAMETAVQRYATAPVAAWTDGDPAYTGLYIALQAQLKDGSWGYVANPSGGFRGFWWNFETIAGGEIYLQLEESALVAKIWAKDASQRRELRKKWYQHVVDAIPGFAKPGKFGSGEYMTVATHGDYRISGPDGRLDLAATVQLLRETTTALSQLAAGAAKLAT